MHLLKCRTSLLVLMLLLETEQWSFCSASSAPVAQKLSITTLDNVQTLHWEPAARHTNLTESQTLPVQQRYTVFIKSEDLLEFSCDNKEYNAYEYSYNKWHRLENCVNTTSTSCEVRLSLNSAIDYDFWVASSEQLVDVDDMEGIDEVYDDIERSDVLAYFGSFHDDVTFSAPRFTAKRLNPSNVIILFYPVTKPWWDCDNLAIFFSKMGNKLEYIIDYYGCQDDPNDPKCRHNAQKIIVSATKASINLTTKNPENTNICVEVKIFFSELDIYSNSTKVCLAPLSVKSPIKLVVLVGLAVFVVIFIILVVWFCHRSGKQLFHKLFRVKKVPGPAVASGVWKDDSSVTVRLTNGSHEEEKEVAVPLNLGLFKLTKEQSVVEEKMKDVKQQQNYVLVTCESASHDEIETQESNSKQPLITSDFAYKNIKDLMMDNSRKVAQHNESQNSVGADLADNAHSTDPHQMDRYINI